MDAPVAEFFDQLASLRADDETPYLLSVVLALAGLALKTDYFAPMIAQIDPSDNGGFPLHVPERGPRLFFLHRPRGVMSAVHSHGCWVAIACVAGVETHQRFDVSDGRAVLSEELQLSRGDGVTLAPPNDVHSHGHRVGHGESPYSLILTGDDQLQFPRREYDVPAGTFRDLPPGEFGTLNLPAQARS